MKLLLTKLSGDHTWIPCESVETENDFVLFGDERDHRRGNQLEKVVSKDDGDHLSTGTMVSEDGALQIVQGEGPGERSSDAEKGPVAAADGDVSILSGPDDATSLDKFRPSEPAAPENVGEAQQAENLKQSTENGLRERREELTEETIDVDGAVQPFEIPENQEQALEVLESGEDDQDLPAPTRMRTRAQAQAASDNTPARTRSATPDSNMESFIHPYFLAPLKSHPDRDLSLPQHEAEETRKYLQLFIQKQEEVCRGVQKVYDGLLRADRYRHLVMKWAKAEAHVGLNRDMSDGEDWYDKEEWGLDEDLKKGQDEDEEDATTTAKKTRNTRRAN